MISKELAGKTGLRYDTVSSYLKTDGPEPSASKAVLLANALDVSVEFLVTGKDKSIPATIRSEVIDLLRNANRLSDNDFNFAKQLIARLSETTK